MSQRQNYYYCGFNLNYGHETETAVMYPTSLCCNLDLEFDRITTGILAECCLSWHSATFITNDGLLLFYPNKLLQPILLSAVDGLSQLSAKSVAATGKNLYILSGHHHIVSFDLQKPLRHHTHVIVATAEGEASPLNPRLQSISCGDNLILALDDKGDAFEITLSQDAFERECYYSLSIINIAHKVTDVSCGKEHVLMLTSGARVLSYGNGSRGQLGNGSTELVKQPGMVDSLREVDIVQLSCGGWHSIVISDIGDVYVWGWNRDGQLGLPANIRDTDDAVDFTEIVATVYTPALLDQFDDRCVTKAACGSRHTALLTECGGVYTSGWNEYGQLGHGDVTPRDVFTQLLCFRDICVSDIFASNWATLIAT